MTEKLQKDFMISNK